MMISLVVTYIFRAQCKLKEFSNLQLYHEYHLNNYIDLILSIPHKHLSYLSCAAVLEYYEF